MNDNREKILAVLITAALLFSIFTIFVYSNQGFNTSAKAAALYEPKTESFLYTKNENARLAMASTTKIMTALVALENAELDKVIRVDDRAVGIEGSSIYLSKGEELTVESLLYSLMLRSANDAAAALAYEISGSIEDFSQLMNQKAAELGLKDTSFTNPHGLDDAEHYTSAHDLAIITAAALKNAKFKEIASTYKKSVESSETERLLVNHNKLLKTYDGCIGVKTGYTKKSGRSLVSAAERDGVTLISVTIAAPDDWSDHRKMLDYGFSRIHAVTLIEEGEFSYELPIIGSDKSSITVKNKDRVEIIYDGNEPNIKKEVIMKRYAVAPIHCGDAIGIITFRDGEKILASTEIIATDDAAKTEKKRLFDIFKL